MKHILLLSVLLLGVSWVAAQDTTNSGSASGQAGSSASSQMAGGSHQSVEGCLSGSDGKYTLTDKSGTAYQLTGDTSKLAEHVGHEVKITGSTSTGSAAASGSASAGSTSAGGGQTLEVSSVKQISKTCANAGGMSK